MGVSYWVEGVIDPDEEWQLMRAVWEACTAAGVAVPQDVDAYFGGLRPLESGQRVRIPGEMRSCGDAMELMEVDLTTLPKGVKRLRFVAGW